MSIFSDKKQEILGDKSLPDTPGVYFFLGTPKPGEGDSGTPKPSEGDMGETRLRSGELRRGKEEILYIGKATSLKSRVRSYFLQDIAVTRGPKIVRMLEQVADVRWQTTDSVLEALLLEAQLIKKHQPPYNTAEKDDKSFYYVIITKEAFPQVLLIRERGMDAHLVGNDMRVKYSFGPFPHGASLKEALKIVRKIFPFRDGSCKPLSGKSCFNAQIGLCPGVCTGAMDAKEYAKTIRNIKLFFEAKKSTVVKHLEKEMKEYAKNLEFEKAQAVKKTLFALNHIHDVSLLKKDASVSSSHTGFRIEAYDVAHLSGKDVVGVMTVVEDGLPNTGEYRQFKLKTETNNDVGNLAEILTRRLQHAEWRFPDLIAVDGSDLQINAVKRVLEALDISIPVVGVVKDAGHKPKDILGDGEMAQKHHDAILLANSEAHRFAIAFHRKRRAKSFLS